MSEQFVYEFLFRGGVTSKPDDDTWHVIIAREVPRAVGEGTELVMSYPMSPEQAEEAGWPLKRIMRSLNQGAIDGVLSYREKARNATADAEATRALWLECEANHEKTIADLREQLGKANDEVRALRDKLGPAQSATPQPKARRSLLNIVSFGLLDKK